MTPIQINRDSLNQQIIDFMDMEAEFYNRLKVDGFRVIDYEGAPLAAIWFVWSVPKSKRSSYLGFTSKELDRMELWASFAYRDGEWEHYHAYELYEDYPRKRDEAHTPFHDAVRECLQTWVESGRGQ